MSAVAGREIRNRSRPPTSRTHDSWPRWTILRFSRVHVEDQTIHAVPHKPAQPGLLASAVPSRPVVRVQVDRPLDEHPPGLREHLLVRGSAAADATRTRAPTSVNSQSRPGSITQGPGQRTTSARPDHAWVSSLTFLLVPGCIVEDPTRALRVSAALAPAGDEQRCR